MRKKDDAKLFILFIVATLIWSIVEFFLEYWYIFATIGSVAIGLYLWVRYGDNMDRVEIVTVDYEVKQERPQLAPMPYSAESKEDDFLDYELIYRVTDIQLKQLLNIYFESLSIVNTSKDIETVDSRIAVMMNAGNELAANPSEELNLFRQNFFRLNIDEILDKAINRYVEKQLQEISRLKTSKGKSRRVEKVVGVIDGLANIPEQFKNRAKEMLLRKSL